MQLSNCQYMVTDPMGNSTYYDYSTTTGLLLSVTDAEGGTISYDYDWAGRLIQLTDQRDNATTYEYDVFGRMVKETNPLGLFTEYAYDDTHGCGSCGGGQGHLISTTDPAGRSTYYEYDDAGRVVEVTYSGSADVVTHTYDDYGQRIATHDNRLPTGDFPTQTFEWEYDNFGRMTKEIYPDGEEVAWQYDAHGRRTKMIDPDGNHTNYTYSNDPDNKKLRLITHPVSGDNHYYYNAHGRLHVMQNYNPIPTFYRHQDDFYYDALGRLANVWSTEAAWENNAFIMTYHYNAASMKHRTNFSHYDSILDEIIPDYDHHYMYDKVYRVTAEEKRLGPWWASTRDYRYDYEYDLAGNRIESSFDKSSTVRNYEYEYNDFNQLVSYVEEGLNADLFEYDANGNQTTISLAGYGPQRLRQHNRENRLVSSEPTGFPGSGLPVSYVYDHTGRLLMRTDSAGNKTKYYYDGINNLLLKEKPTGGTCWRTKRVYALQQASIGQVLATRDYNYSGTNCTPVDYLDTWYKYNDVGNVIATLDYDGNITSRIDMESFGTVHKGGGYDTPRLTTKEYDADSELYYFNQRWYDKEQGVFTQKSIFPIDIESVYSFNEANPINYIDPLGLLRVCCRGVGGGGGESSKIPIVSLFDHCYFAWPNKGRQTLGVYEIDGKAVPVRNSPDDAVTPDTLCGPELGNFNVPCVLQYGRIFGAANHPYHPKGSSHSPLHRNCNNFVCETLRHCGMGYAFPGSGSTTPGATSVCP